MAVIRIVTLVFLISLVPALPVRSQMEQELAGGGRTQELVDHLKEVIRVAEQDRRSSFTLTKQLKELVRRYDWPWSVSLLSDDFRDGDFTYDPRWVVREGEFRVVRGAGLRSYFDPTASGTYRASDRRTDGSALELLGELLLGGRERAAGETPSGAKSEAEIFTRVGISNAFALKVRLNLMNYGDRNTRLEFGPYQGEERASGYRLAYESGRNPSLSLMRFAPFRSAVIETVDQGTVLDDGAQHTLEWRRSKDGEMVVLLDSKEVIRTIDRAYDNPFDGFSVINRGGEFEIKQVSILGAP